ncbi:TIGR03067 domain-containing protein [Singulisphaera sp. PoT]|uniref:TIGR03067 domain-containing protein n=1 Tax=Singulisphaera sp. PoT TaxID=3411797 RepID=UPI003BF4DC68
MTAKLSASVLVLGLVVLAAGAAPIVDGDLARLQGQWEAKVGQKKATKVRLEIKGHTVNATFLTPHGIKIKAEGEVNIDESTSPKALDWVKFTTLDGEEVPEVRAIYRIEGDRLVIRSGGFNDQRPKEFNPGEGVWAAVLVFERPIQ